MKTYTVKGHMAGATHMFNFKASQFQEAVDKFRALTKKWYDAVELFINLEEQEIRLDYYAA